MQNSTFSIPLSSSSVEFGITSVGLLRSGSASARRQPIQWPILSCVNFQFLLHCVITIDKRYRRTDGRHARQISATCWRKKQQHQSLFRTVTAAVLRTVTPWNSEAKFVPLWLVNQHQLSLSLSLCLCQPPRVVDVALVFMLLRTLRAPLCAVFAFCQLSRIRPTRNALCNVYAVYTLL